jgi:hypothetical protein
VATPGHRERCKQALDSKLFERRKADAHT